MGIASVNRPTTTLPPPLRHAGSRRPAADGVAHPARARSAEGGARHAPLRPMWCCRVCGQPWPCAPARLRLRTEYDGNPIGLSIYLAGLMCDAMRDLYHLDPHGGPDPKVLFERFLAWATRRRPVEPP